ncbi:ABC transporter transmembrane domain-containing protein [Novosphingobium rosa]|uniref:ABC transporter transmembrane domain-containing protein n=1 Tax=Novosphingobium rosa TaxID=76978 RepID=UPI000A03F277
MTIDAPAPAAEPAPSATDALSQIAPASPAPQEVPVTGKDARKLGALAMIWRAAVAYPGRVTMALLALVTSSAATLGVPMMFRLIIDHAFAPGSKPEDVGIWFEGLLAVVAVLALATALRFYNVSWLGERVVADIRIAVQRNLLRLPPSFFEENSPREISSRLTSDTTLIEQAVGTTASIALRNIITGTGGIVFLFLLAPRLTLWLLLGIVCVVAPITIFGRRLKGAARNSQDRVAEIGGLVSEVLGATRIVQAFNQEGLEAERFSAKVESTFETAKRRIVIRACMTGVAMFLVFGALNVLMWRGAVGVARHEITGGTIAAFVLTGGVVAGAFGALSEVYGDLVRAAGAASRLSELLQEKPAIAAPARPIILPEPARGAISFEGVTFRYPTRPEYMALSDFTLKVEPGETVAIVGPSGAGKSTIFQLAERFYDPATGAIKLDGVPLTGADPADIRRRIALVPQEGVLFAASARDNLRYGNWHASDAQIWDAAAAANAESFLRALPEGLDTFLGEGGARLSGGQRQRIAIARALLREAPILLLDEATSALDAESERLVQDALDRLMASRTTLVIAHRLSTVRAADRIVVMENGRIVEVGRHDELARAGGLYARLASLQFDENALSVEL